MAKELLRRKVKPETKKAFEGAKKELKKKGVQEQ
jgi:hypothetical protein